jgi:mono/diheme cytochrome c family protein/cytochrome c553
VGGAAVNSKAVGVIGVVALCLGTGVARAQVKPTAVTAEFFEREIRPILVDQCQACHGPKEAKAGLRLTSRAELLKGGKSGPAAVAGKPDASLLLKAIDYSGALKMPPSGKLPSAQIAKVRQWIAMGAPWPETKVTGAPAGEWRPTEAQRQWWAYQPLRPKAPPFVKPASKASGIDRFLLAELPKRGLKPTQSADRRTLIRRVTFDLTGLPPTPDEVSSFVNDPAPGAWERVVDRLLASPQYGEKMARRWLDVARYADYHDGNPKARDNTCEPLEAWRYRDWVVRSFNRDLPYNDFITHQVAGDLLPKPEGKEFYEDGLVATTFLSNGSWDRGDADKEKMVSDMVDDQIDTVGKAFMGLTLGCARCHNHKFDPVSTKDYYALAGIFYSTRILKDIGTKGGNYFLLRTPLASAEYVKRYDAQVQAIAALNARIAELDKQSPRDEVARKKLIDERAELQSKALVAPPPYAEAAQDAGTPATLFPRIGDVPVHIRGSYTRLGDMVPRRMPEFFAGASQPSITQGSGRKELAAFLTSPKNALTARVIVNRVWQWHFGSGIVKTPNNFGLLSEAPTHPALLDWLASRFVRPRSQAPERFASPKSQVSGPREGGVRAAGCR